MSSRLAARGLAALFAALVVGASATVFGLQRHAAGIDGESTGYAVAQQRAGEVAAAALAALRRDRKVDPEVPAQRLRRDVERLEVAHPQDLLLVTAGWATRGLLDAVKLEQDAIGDPDASLAPAVVVNEFATAHGHVQRLLGVSRARNERRALAANARADRLSAAVMGLFLALAGALGKSWLVLRRRADRAAFAASRARTFAAMSRNASDMLLVLDDDGIVTAQAGDTTVLDTATGDLVGRAFAPLVHPDDQGLMCSLMDRGVVEWRLRHCASRWVHVETRATDLRDDPNVHGLVLTTRDISQRKDHEQQLRHHAFHDALTHLPNRALFEDRLDHALLAARRHGGQVALLYVDLDDFKSINDELGHRAGDEVLVAAAMRLSETVRLGDTVARLGGDEFAVLIESAAHPDEPAKLVERVLAAFTAPIVVGGKKITVVPSVGIAVSGEEFRADELLHAADCDMYSVKRARRGSPPHATAETRNAGRPEDSLRGDVHALTSGSGGSATRI